jgi:hypothetical protein
MTLSNYIKKKKRWFDKCITISDIAKKHYNTIFKYLYEGLLNNKSLSHIDDFNMGFDDDRGSGFIYIVIRIFNKNRGNCDYIYINFYIQGDIEYGNITLTPYMYTDNIYRENTDDYPWFRVVEFLKNADTLEDIHISIKKYLESDLYQKEKCPY